MQTTKTTRKKTPRQPGARVIFALVIREMSTSYGRSAMGYLWAILEPVAAITLLTVVFSLAFRAPAMGTSFPLFYATGYLPFMYYMGTCTNIAASIKFNKPLLFYPRVTYIDSIFARFLLSFVTHTVTFYIIIIGILLIEDTRAVLQFQFIFSAFLMASCFSIGIGLINCFLFEISPGWQTVWSILNRPMFIISGIFFIPESIPDPFRSYLLINPLVHIISEMRRGFYPYYDGVHTSHIYVYGLSITLAAIGLFLLKRYNKDILDL